MISTIGMRSDSETTANRNMNFVATALALRDWILTSYFNSGIRSVSDLKISKLKHFFLYTNYCKFIGNGRFETDMVPILYNPKFYLLIPVILIYVYTSI